MDYQTTKKGVRIFISGDIDHHSAGIIRKDIDRIIFENEPKEVYLNFKRVQFCDSSGIAIVLGRYKISLKMGFVLYLEDLPLPIENIFRLSKLDQIVTFKEKDVKTREKSYK